MMELIERAGRDVKNSSSTNLCMSSACSLADPALFETWLLASAQNAGVSEDCTSSFGLPTGVD
jgi:hypothetical protein